MTPSLELFEVCFETFQTFGVLAMCPRHFVVIVSLFQTEFDHFVDLVSGEVPLGGRREDTKVQFPCDRRYVRMLTLEFLKQGAISNGK